MMDRGHSRDSTQCRVKLKELRQTYQKAKESNRPELQTSRFYAELQAILGGATTITPPLSVDSDDGVLSVTMPEDFVDREDEEEEDEVEETTQHIILPNSQDLFLTLTEVPSQPSQGGIPDHEAVEGTSAANVSSLPPPSQRLSQIRRQKKGRAMKCSLSSCRPPALKELSRKGGGTQLHRTGKQSVNVSRGGGRKIRGCTMGLLREQTDMMQRLVEVQERQQERLPLQPLFNHLPSSPCSIAASSPRRPRTRVSRVQAPNHSIPMDRRLSFNKY
ncbi:uncharacterized protein LOC127043175 [Gopherus flavomarginatus]|uniref:uncharacterized protein LOC127043175 n=1 Tax=Gopherus flavomarginatus TaxID=286002 RepID=UPI0021CBDC0D|nr:uncharacterized protein LOC127043175 [Gopherus flavomarginatus]